MTDYLADCKAGKHVPAGVLDDEGKVVEVLCQNCAVEMTVADWERYHGRKLE